MKFNENKKRLKEGKKFWKKFKDMSDPLFRHLTGGYIRGVTEGGVCNVYTTPPYLSTYVDIYLSTYLPMSISTYLPMIIIIYLPIYLSIYLLIYLYYFQFTYSFNVKLFAIVCYNYHLYFDNIITFFHSLKSFKYDMIIIFLV